MRHLDYLDSVNITCNSENRGNVTWFKIDSKTRKATKITKDKLYPQSKVNQRNYLEMNSTLILKNVTPKDSGKYVCSKHNGYNRTRNVTVQVFVKGWY